MALCNVAVILIPLNGVFLRHKPQDLNLQPDGDILEDCIRKEGPANNVLMENRNIDWTLKSAIPTVRFWAMFIFPFLAILGIYIVLLHNVRFMVDQGVDKMTAAIVFAMIGVISSIFRIFWGWLSDRVGREKTYSMGMVCGSLGLLSLILLEVTDLMPFVYSFFVFFGIGWGAYAPMFMATAADLFKGKGFGLIYGVIEGGVGIAGALGAWIGGYVFDRTGSYQGAFIVAIVAMMLSIGVIWVAAPRKANIRNSNE